MHWLERSEYCDDNGKDGGQETWNNVQITPNPDDTDGKDEKKNCYDDQWSYYVLCFLRLVGRVAAPAAVLSLFQSFARQQMFSRCFDDSTISHIMRE